MMISPVISRHGVASLASLLTAVFLLWATAAMAAAYNPEAFIREMASLKDRSLGSDGLAQAADMVEEEFRRLVPGAGSGQEKPVIGRQLHLTPVQHAGGASLTLLDSGRTVDIKPARFNLLSCPTIAPGGVTGRIVYAGGGSLAEFNGLDPAGAVVLMDMDSGKNWINAARLGAKAVIYVDPGLAEDPAPRNVFEDKVEQTPIDFARFWMPRKTAEMVFGRLQGLGRKDRGRQVRLESASWWQNVVSENVYCWIPGTDPDFDGQATVIQAFFDSTGYIPGASPGADEAVSIVTLLDIARDLGRNPPSRSVLLLATSGHGQGAAGVRDFAWYLQYGQEDLETLHNSLFDRTERSGKALALLEDGFPFTSGNLENQDRAALLKEAFLSVIKDEIDAISTRLMRLRLKKGVDKEKIKNLAARRLTLKRLKWPRASVHADIPLSESERSLLLELVDKAKSWQEKIFRDASRQLKCLESGLDLRELVADKKIAAFMGLHLSSHGYGVGGFDKGWLYDLKTKIKRTRLLSPIDDLLHETADKMPEVGHLLQDTLRPSRIRPWQSWLPDRPSMGGEPMALAGFPAFTLATVQDARPNWGTPYDLPVSMDMESMKRQGKLVLGLARALCDQPLSTAGEMGKSGWSTLVGRANLLRQGELFPDQPAVGTVFLTFQGPARFYSMVDTEGRFWVKGLAIRSKFTVHKAILEGFRFHKDTGRAMWAADKPLTGKSNYRVKTKRSVMETSLIMFSCGQTTFFNMLEPRTYRYLYVPELIDARTESKPLRYWLSRLDTRDSTLGTFFLEPDVPLKLTLSDNFVDKKVLLLNGSPENPRGKGYLIGNWHTVPYTEYKAARDMWNLLTPRILNLENKGIVNERIRDLRLRGTDALARADSAMTDLKWDETYKQAGESLAIASQVYTQVEKLQKDVLVGVLFYIALFIPFAYCMERLLFSYSEIKRRIIAFLGLLLSIIGVVYTVHPAFELTYSPTVVILAFFILGLSLLVSSIIFFRFEREMVDLQRRSRQQKVVDLSRTSAFAAAFTLGVGNLRRRPLRTALTCVTLVILTFTIMNFTAVKSVRTKGWTPFSEKASYHGFLMKYFGWKDMPVESLSAIRNVFEDRGLVLPRTWYVTQDDTRAPMVDVHVGSQDITARGMIGLSWQEPLLSGLDRGIVEGRWFRKGERNEIILPLNMAQSLGVRPGEDVHVWGMPFTVAGCPARRLAGLPS